MRMFYQALMVVCSLGLASCQTVQVPNVFKLQSADASIVAAVQERLRLDPQLGSYNLHVEAKDRVVYLSGYVKTIRQSDTAGDLAGKIHGVKMVENNIIVRK